MKFVLSISLLLSSLTMTASATSLNEAWKAIGDNDLATAQAAFQSVLKTDSNNVRALVGMSLLLELQKKEAEAWPFYKRVLRVSDNPSAYMYSAWLTGKISQNMYDQKTGIIDILESFGKKADESGVLRAMAHEYLGNIYQRKNNFLKAKGHYQKIGAIELWRVIGPFENISAAGFNTSFPPEREYSSAAQYEGKNGVPVRWATPPTIKFDKWVDMQAYFGDRQAIFYANTFVYSPKKQLASVRVGTSGSLKTFLNDQEIIRDSLETNNDFDTYVVNAELQQGWNRLLVKVGYSEIERCNFFARITDASGNPIPGLKYDSLGQDYPKGVKSPVEVVENFAIRYFREKINKAPDYLENYFLLADCHLRNDQALEAELVLRQASKLIPNAGLLHKYYLDTYSRGRKRDELITTYERLYSLSKDYVDGLQFKFDQHLDNKDFDRAEEALMRIERLLPESETGYALRMQFYNKKGLTEKAIQTAKDAYTKFPSSWQFTTWAAAIDYQTTRKYEGSIDIYKKYLKSNWTEAALVQLAKTYLDASKLDDWEKTYRQAIEYSLSSPGFYYQMSSVYIQLQKYEKAAEMARKTLEFCPTCGGYWARLGESYRARKINDTARTMYRTALSFNYADYDTREILRELEGKKSIYTVFDNIDRDSMLRVAPKDSDHPEASAAIVFETVKRVVYPEGASESYHELLLRVFNEKGIDLVKEFRIGYNSNMQGLIFENAVTIKPDGSEVRADVSRNTAVFKTLEKNDFIYLKYRLRNYHSGKLARHFWESFNFNRFIPVKEARYQLLVPKDFSFHYRYQGFNGEPKVRETNDGSMYTWATSNEPGIVYENDMPGLDEIGKVLRLSSIPDWDYLVKWYAELAQTKAQSSFEISEKVREIVPNPSSVGEMDKIRAVYDYITENIRYSMVSFRQSAFIPQKARDVLVNRIGDCKDVSTLGIAMLGELGIKADYVLVNSGDEVKVRNSPPSIEFNHCIISVNTLRGPLFLDLTANNIPMGAVPDMDRDAFSLLIRDGTAEPFTLPRTQLVAPTLIGQSVVNIGEDNAIQVSQATTYTGTLTAYLRGKYKDKTSSEREKMLQTSLAGDFPNVQLRKLVMPDMQQMKPSVTLMFEYRVPGYLNDAADYKILRVPWTQEISPQDGLSYEKRTYPIKYRPGIDTIAETIDFILPPGYEPVAVPKPVRMESDIATYKMEQSFQNGVLKVNRVFIHKKSWIESKEYQTFKDFYNAAIKEDSKQILLRKRS